MDYKTNMLTMTVKAEMVLLPEINGLKFAAINNGDTFLFDYTAYFEDNDFLKPVDYKVFMRSNKAFIEAIAESKGIKTSEMFYQNTNGHILVVIELVYLFLGYVNPELFLYFNSLINDVLGRGVAYSDSYIYTYASNRLPTEALQEIISIRNENEESNQQQPDASPGI